MRTEQPTTFVDAHCHLDLYRDPTAIIAEIERERVHTVAVTNAPSVFFHTQNLARGTTYVHPAIGLHPELVHSHGKELPKLLEGVSTANFVGEVGLDYQTQDVATRKQQREVFAAVLARCAALSGKFITVHSRRSASDVLAAIGTGYPCPVVLHWFSGSKKELRQAIASSLYFSVNPAMVRSKSGLALVREMPPERVLTETDGPFVEVAGKPATPGRVAEVLTALASLWKEAPEDVARRVSHTFAALATNL